MEHASYGWARRVLDIGEKPTLHVVIIYQNRTAGYRAKDFYERIVSAFDGACHFRLDLWNFQVLAMPQINKTAAKAAAQADLVILSMCRKCQLPPEVKNWMETWPSLITNTNPAVAALVENHESNRGAATWTLSYLRSVADRYGLSLFTHKIFRTAKSEQQIDPGGRQISPIARHFPFYNTGKTGSPDSSVSQFGKGVKRANGNSDNITKNA
jgi:hypothetical protein